MDRLLAFVREVTEGIETADQVDEEKLADAFRKATRLSAFPSEAALRRACSWMGIGIDYFGSPTTLRAANYWKNGQPQITLNRSLKGQNVLRAICHELREVIEGAMRQARPGYEGIDTRDNHEMNPRSERFAGAVLVPATSTRLYLREIDYDPVLFARWVDRSLPTALVRMGQLLAGAPSAPSAMYWLFEAPWALASAGKSELGDLKARYWCITNRFPARQNGPLESYRRHCLVPHYGMPVTEMTPIVKALQTGRSSREDFRGLSPKDYDCTVIAEPILMNGRPWRALVCTALTRDVDKLRGWLDWVEIGVPHVVSHRELAQAEVA